MRPPANLSLLLLAILGLPFVVAACATDRESATYSRMYAEARGPSDAELAERIEKALEWDGILGQDSDNVHARVVDGSVTLDGTVRREGTVERLDEVIPGIPGVVSVLNLVALEPSYGTYRLTPGWAASSLDWTSEPSDG